MSKEELLLKLRHRKNIEGYSYLMDKEQIDICIEALEKQIAKKPEVWANGTLHCPNCEHDLTYISSEDEYCCRCGQKLEGEEDEC